MDRSPWQPNRAWSRSTPGRFRSIVNDPATASTHLNGSFDRWDAEATGTRGAEPREWASRPEPPPKRSSPQQRAAHRSCSQRPLAPEHLPKAGYRRLAAIAPTNLPPTKRREAVAVVKLAGRVPIHRG